MGSEKGTKVFRSIGHVLFPKGVILLYYLYLPHVLDIYYVRNILSLKTNHALRMPVRLVLMRRRPHLAPRDRAFHSGPLGDSAFHQALCWMPYGLAGFLTPGSFPFLPFKD